MTSAIEIAPFIGVVLPQPGEAQAILIEQVAVMRERLTDG